MACRLGERARCVRCRGRRPSHSSHGERWSASSFGEPDPEWNFPTINETVPNDGYLTVNAGDPTTISDWTVDTPSVYSGEGAGSVDVVSSGYNDWGCDGSNNCIDLAGTPGPPGGLYQDVTTTIGEEYSLSFASAVNGDEATGISHTMGVTVTGVTDDTVDASDVVTALSRGAPLQWAQNTVTFFASSAQSQIEFDDTTAGDTNQGPTLANVSLTAVPDVITASPVTPPSSRKLSELPTTDRWLRSRTATTPQPLLLPASSPRPSRGGTAAATPPQTVMGM